LALEENREEESVLVLVLIFLYWSNGKRMMNNRCILIISFLLGQEIWILSSRKIGVIFIN
jgi:hypothetical protein